MKQSMIQKRELASPSRLLINFSLELNLRIVKTRQLVEIGKQRANREEEEEKKQEEVS